MDLLEGKAGEEPLAEVVPHLVSALHALWGEGEAVAQVSLPEAHLELGLLRRGGEVELSIAKLERPAQLARRVTLDFAELAEATARCGRGLAEDLKAAAPQLGRSQAARRMAAELRVLEKAGPAPLRRPFAQSGFGYRRFAVEPVAFGFELLDEEDRLLAVDHRMRGALPSLLCPGSVSLQVAREEVWRAKGVPFLLALELSRQAAELTHALELEERRFAFSPGGAGHALELRLPEGKLKAGSKTVAVEPARLVRAMWELGQELAFAASVRNPAQGKNPYLVELTARCREGLSHARPTGEPRAGPPAVERERAPTAQPLSTTGKVRRLRFEPLWEAHGLGDEQAGHLLLGGKGPIVATPHLAAGFSAAGAPLFRRASDHGVAISREGLAVCAEGDRVLCYRGAGASARWLHNHDGLPVGPLLWRKQGLLVTTSEGRAALAFSEVTGREVWRQAPGRTRRMELSVQGHRALLTTDSGYLLGLDLQDGQARYRVRSPLPFLGPAVAWGRRWVALLGRKERCGLLVADAHSGVVAWNLELSLGRPSQPVPAGSRVALAGERDGEGLVVCFGPQGKQVWERTLHLGGGPYRLLAVGRGDPRHLAHRRGDAAGAQRRGALAPGRGGGAGGARPGAAGRARRRHPPRGAGARGGSEERPGAGGGARGSGPVRSPGGQQAQPLPARRTGTPDGLPALHPLHRGGRLSPAGRRRAKSRWTTRPGSGRTRPCATSDWWCWAARRWPWRRSSPTAWPCGCTAPSPRPSPARRPPSPSPWIRAIPPRSGHRATGATPSSW